MANFPGCEVVTYIAKPGFSIFEIYFVSYNLKFAPRANPLISLLYTIFDRKCSTALSYTTHWNVANCLFYHVHIHTHMWSDILRPLSVTLVPSSLGNHPQPFIYFRELKKQRKFITQAIFSAINVLVQQLFINCIASIPYPVESHFKCFSVRW